MFAKENLSCKRSFTHNFCENYAPKFYGPQKNLVHRMHTYKYVGCMYVRV